MWFQKPPLGTPLDWGNPLNDETVLALALNEGHGDKVQDLSLNGNHGTLNNFAFPPTAASGWNPGPTGIGLNFDGINDFIDCGNNASLSIANEVTISAMVKYGADPTTFNGMIVSGDDSYALYSRSLSNGILCEIRSPVLARAIFPFASFDWTEWIRVVGTYDGANVRMFVNGMEGTPAAQTGAMAAIGGCYVGSQTSPPNLEFVGSVDQPRIMNRAWSAKEAKDYAINPWQVYLDE